MNTKRKTTITAKGAAAEELRYRRVVGGILWRVKRANMVFDSYSD